MKVAVISSVYGGFDRAYSPPEQDIPVDWIMVSDRQDSALPPWRVVIEKRSPKTEPRLQSRVAKCRPDLYTDADITIWTDANIKVTSPHFASWCVDSLGAAPLCQNRQNRGTGLTSALTDEIRATREIPKWDDDPIEQMVKHYIAQGYPKDYGIWWCGFIIRNQYLLPNFGDEWMTEMVRWTGQDQFAWSYLLWKHGIKPAPLDLTMTANLSTFNDLVGFQVTASQSEYFHYDLHPDNSE